MSHRKVLCPSIFVFITVGSFISGISCHSSGKIDEERVILGIFGGMGPGATADLYRKIVELTPAATDQEHIPTLIYSLPQVPDRMASIRAGADTILPFLLEGLTKLQDGGADLIVIPCNTVHYFFDRMQKSVKVPILNMIGETTSEVHRLYPDAGKVGLLATTGTIETGLYNRALEKRGYEVLIPADSVQEHHVMKAVFSIKAGADKAEAGYLLAAAARSLVAEGASLIVLGCTEIPLAFDPGSVNIPVVDATRVLAERSVARYFEICRRN